MQHVMTDEIWKDIEGYDGRYMVSNLGRVKNCQRNKLMALSLDKDGYLTVQLTLNKAYKNHKVHRLVATHYIENINNLPEVNHKDKVRRNCQSSNLEWITRQGNVEHSKAKYFDFISPSDTFVRVFNLSKFCRDKSLDQGTMSRVHSGAIPQHKGWRKHYATT